MQEAPSLFSGDLIGVNLVTWHTPRCGWSLRVQYHYEYAPAGAPTSELYNNLGRGELLDVLDALREELGTGTEY